MGRALEPGIRVPLYLDYDMSKPVDKRPVFFSKSLSMRVAQRLSEAYDDYFANLRNNKEAGPSQMTTGAVDLLISFVTDWANQVDPETGEDIPFNGDSFPDVVTQAEAFELVRKAISGTTPNVEEKKSSE